MPGHRTFGSRRNGVAAASLATGVGLLLFLPWAAALSAQTVSGKIIEKHTATPLADVEIQIRDGSGTRIGPALRTDPDGLFSMRVPLAGPYTVSVRRLGYIPSVHDVLVAGRGIARIEIVLAIQPAKLEEVRVARTPSQRPHFMEGFEQRRRLGMGMFFTREEVQRSGTTTLSNFIRGYTGIQMSSRPGRTSANFGPTSMFRACNIALFVDGMRMHSSSATPDQIFRSFESIPPSHIEGIEIYRGRSQLPAEFGGPEVRCGAIVVWTRRPGLDSSQEAPNEVSKPSADARKKDG